VLEGFDDLAMDNFKKGLHYQAKAGANFFSYLSV
jgi:hypothetical protein